MGPHAMGFGESAANDVRNAVKPGESGANDVRNEVKVERAK